jgi:hypothetical protein
MVDNQMDLISRPELVEKGAGISGQVSLQRNLQNAGSVCGPISAGWCFTAFVVDDSTAAALNTGGEPVSNFAENGKSRCRGIAFLECAHSNSPGGG